MVSHCGFDLPFPNNEWYWTSFQVLIIHCISSLEKSIFRSFAHFFFFKSGWLFCVESFGFLYILDINPMSDIGVANIFSNSMDCYLCPLMHRRFLKIWYCQICLFLLLRVLLVSFARNHCQIKYYVVFSFKFSCNILLIMINPLLVNFICGVGSVSCFILLHMDINYPNTIVENTVLFLLNDLDILSWTTNHFTVCVKASCWAFYSVPLFYVSVLMPGLYSFDYCSFIV